MAAPIEQTLAGVGQLNRPGQPFAYWVEGNKIIGRWLWQDQTLFNPAAVNDEVRTFAYICELQPDGTYKDHTEETSRQSGITAGDGKVGLSFGGSSFKGMSTRHEWTGGIGRDNQTGQVGFVTASLDTELVKKPLRDYLAYYGWEHKGGLMSKLFGG